MKITMSAKKLNQETILNLMVLKKYEKNLSKEQYSALQDVAKTKDHNTFKQQLFSVVKG